MEIIRTASFGIDKLWCGIDRSSKSLFRERLLQKPLQATGPHKDCIYNKVSCCQSSHGSTGVRDVFEVTLFHYNAVIMGTMASQITSLTIVYSTVYSDADYGKKTKLRVTGLYAGNSPGTGEFPAQMASNAENVSIWWRHHGQGRRRSITADTVINLYSVWLHYDEYTNFTNTSKYRDHIPQFAIQNKNMHVSAAMNGLFGDMGLLHCGICGIGLFVVLADEII